MAHSDPLGDPEGTQPCSRTARGGKGELPQRLGDARYEQQEQARQERDPDGVGDTVRGWFRKGRS